MIQGVNRNYVSNQKYDIKEKQNKTNVTADTSNSQRGDTIEIGSSKDMNITYSNPLRKKLSTEEVDKLWKEAEKSTEALKRLVRDVISNQGNKVGAKDTEKQNMVLDTDSVFKLQSAIAEDGEWGVEAVSDRIVDFAKAISGGDKSKLEELKKAIDKGFEEAKNFLGGTLPDISYKTYDRIMEKLDQWAAE